MSSIGMARNLDPGLERNKGGINGESWFQFFGRAEKIGTSFGTVWNVDDGVTTGLADDHYLTTGTTLFASSSSALDTQTLVCIGLDENYGAIGFADNPVPAFVTLSGQTQVAIPSVSWLRFLIAQNISSTSLQGTVYIAEADTLTGGVPDTFSKIKAQLSFLTAISGPPVHANITSSGLFTVPAGFTFYVKRLVLAGGKGDDADLFVRLRAEGGVFASTPATDVYQQDVISNTESDPKVLEKSDIDIMAKSDNPDTGIVIFAQGVLAKD